jgi:hypothetical protein
MIKNNYSKNVAGVFTVLLVSLSFFSNLFAFSSGTIDPSAPDYNGRKGISIYVSKSGNNSDGSSWTNAYHTIQAAMSAVPDDKGGHIIIIRPDTYIEANLHPSHKGADGSCNLLVGDFDGSLGSGARGWVIIDSSTPEIAVIQDPVGLAAGEGNAKFIIVKEGPKAGFKSVDWWAPWRTGLGNNNDAFGHWIFRNLYATGSEAGMYFERDINAPIIVENCVGIGRAFAGGGAGTACYRDGKWEPSLIFRRCYFMCLDWWGDAGGVAIAGSDTSMPEHPGVLFEDCTIVSPDNAVQVLNPSLYVRAEFRNCRMIVLNFSQPRGTPSSGIICCDVADSKYLHVDLEDCTLMGFKVFGTGKQMGKISYTTKGKVQAYVEYEQSVPEGFERLELWPKKLFDYIAVPEPQQLQPLAVASVKALPSVDAGGRPLIKKQPALSHSDVVFMGPADNNAYMAYKATFTAWGGANTIEEVKRHHDLGIACTGSMWCLTAGAELIHNDPNIREACCRDIEGNPVEVPWLFDQTYMGTKSYWGCTNNPVYWELCRQRVRQAMAGKADGLHIDDYMGVASSAWFHGGGLCDHCIMMFRKYLKEQATKEQLIAAGVDDPDTFDYRDLIRKYAKTREEYMKVQKKIPLMDLFLAFHMQKVMEHVSELGELAEEVAGHPVLLSVNGNPYHEPHSYMTKCVTHFVCEVGQSASAGTGKISEAVESYKAVERLGKPMAATASGQDWAYIKEHQCEELVRFWIALAYANGQRFMVPDPKNQWCFNEKLGTHWYAAPIEAYAPLYQFIRTNAGWFDNFNFIEGQVEAPDNVLCTIRQKGKMGPVVIHLLNLNYNIEKKQMENIKNLDISLRKSIWGEVLPDVFTIGQIKHARILSYDRKEQIIPISVDKERVTVKLPGLGLWSMVVLE